MLNARRHQCGDHTQCCYPSPTLARCSTPEGINAAITVPLAPLKACWYGAQRPKASMRRSRYAWVPREGKLRCSTPEGINAAITRPCRGTESAGGCAQRPKASMRRSRAGRKKLNALSMGAQRPKASMRRSLIVLGQQAKWARVLNARRHQCGDHMRPPVRDVQRAMCSTPEGINAAITRASRIAFWPANCAQRPKASMRRSPGNHRCRRRAR